MLGSGASGPARAERRVGDAGRFEGEPLAQDGPLRWLTREITLGWVEAMARRKRG